MKNENNYKQAVIRANALSFSCGLFETGFSDTSIEIGDFSEI